LVKLDIEGAEVQALLGAGAVLREVRPAFVIELHGPECEAGVRRILLESGYALFNLCGAPIPNEATLATHVVARPKAVS
jgi:hypothetical protein